MANKKLAELYSAISNSKIQIAKEILQETPSLLEIETPIGSWLHVAARYGDLDIIRLCSLYLCKC